MVKDISMYSSNVGAELYFSKCESGVSLSFVYGGLEASPQLYVHWSGHFNIIVALVLYHRPSQLSIFLGLLISGGNYSQITIQKETYLQSLHFSLFIGWIECQ